MLRKHGLSVKACDVIFQASHATYAVAALGGFYLFPIYRFNAAVRKSIKWGITNRIFETKTLNSHVQFQLFKHFRDNVDCSLYQLLLDLRTYTLRKRGHKFLLLTVCKDLFKKELYCYQFVQVYMICVVYCLMFTSYIVTSCLCDVMGIHKGYLLIYPYSRSTVNVVNIQSTRH